MDKVAEMANDVEGCQIIAAVPTRKNSNMSERLCSRALWT